MGWDLNLKTTRLHIEITRLHLDAPRMANRQALSALLLYDGRRGGGVSSSAVSTSPNTGGGVSEAAPPPTPHNPPPEPSTNMTRRRHDAHDGWSGTLCWDGVGGEGKRFHSSQSQHILLKTRSRDLHNHGVTQLSITMEQQRLIWACLMSVIGLRLPLSSAAPAACAVRSHLKPTTPCLSPTTPCLACLANVSFGPVPLTCHPTARL